MNKLGSRVFIPIIISLSACTVVLSVHSREAWAAYQVKGKAYSTTVWLGGESRSSKSNDEVIYIVDLEARAITRTALVNADFKEGPFAGLQNDNTVYQIVYDGPGLVTRNDAKNRNQHIIKAIGQTGNGDGFETIVIGDDFIQTSNSKFDYFVLYSYKRVE